MIGAPTAVAKTAPRGRPSRRGKVGVVTVAVLIGVLLALHYSAGPSGLSGSPGRIPIVAAENFWGSLIAQLGGDRVSVLSIVTDPNADPHEYESNASDAVAIANAWLVVENGAGYDSWCEQLVSASEASHRTVLNVADVLGKRLGDNPHFWYSAAYVTATLGAMYADLVGLDPSHVEYYRAQYMALNASMASAVTAPEAAIRANFSGVPVAATESIFVYLANSTGLDLVSQVEFMTAVSEGTDPPASSVIAFEDQLTSGTVHVLVYNAQTATPLTQQMRALAGQYNVSVTAVTETIQPSGVAYEVWLHAELLELESALVHTSGGR